MKKSILLILALFFTTASFSQGVISLFNRSEGFFKLMQENKFTEAQALFDPSVQAKISAAQLQQLWQGLETKLGKAESIDPLQSKKDGEYFAVTLEGKFANDTQNFLFIFNKAESLVGLFLPPKSTDAAYVKAPYADTTLYKESEIYIVTPGHKLVGLLTVPKKAANFPVVVLVHGSGPADMDETIGANKPFKDLAAGLAAKGIATIRYVKRTTVYSSEFGKTFTVKEEVMDDALAAVALAKTVPGADKKQIYILGHSLGGMLAPRIASLSPDLKGIILVAAPARKFTDIVAEQNKYMFARANDTTQEAKTQLQKALAEVETTRITKLGTLKADSSLLGIPASYWIDLNLYDQLATAKKLNKRILIVQGGNDFQVSVDDYNLWNGALGKKRNVTLKLYPELNHLLSVQKEKGDAGQYKIPANVSEVLISDVASWIKGK